VLLPNNDIIEKSNVEMFGFEIQKNITNTTIIFEYICI